MPSNFERLRWAEQNLNSYPGDSTPLAHMHIETAIIFMQIVSEGMGKVKDEFVKELRHAIIHNDASKASYWGKLLLSRFEEQGNVKYGINLSYMEAIYEDKEGVVHIEQDLPSRLRNLIRKWKPKVKHYEELL